MPRFLIDSGFFLRIYSEENRISSEVICISSEEIGITSEDIPFSSEEMSLFVQQKITQMNPKKPSGLNNNQTIT